MNIDILPLNSEMELNEAFESSVNHILKCSRWKLTLKAEKKKRKKHAGRGHRITMPSNHCFRWVFFSPNRWKFSRTSGRFLQELCWCNLIIHQYPLSAFPHLLHPQLNDTEHVCVASQDFEGFGEYWAMKLSLKVKPNPNVSTHCRLQKTFQKFPP